jgi:surface carbohydrate biosynthesis protein
MMMAVQERELRLYSTARCSDHQSFRIMSIYPGLQNKNFVMASRDHKAHKSLIIPIETQHREFLAKLHLAAVAATKGFEVIIGDQNEIIRRLGQFPSSIYLEKSISKTKYKHLKRLRSFGHVPVALCEEGLVYRNADAYRRERIYPDCFELVDRFYMWGRHQLEDVEVVLGKNQRLRVTGNPRFDLLRQEMRGVWQTQVEKIRSRFGQFILINTNFGRANRINGMPDVVELLKKRGTLGGDRHIEFYRGWVDHLDRIQHYFLEMLPDLACALSRHRIIVRPHPSENHSPWKKIATGFDNVNVIHEGSAIPWIIAARAVVHNSCTTGVEAWLLDRPVFTYLPFTNDLYDSKLPNELSEQFNSTAGLIEALQKAVEMERTAIKDERREKLARYYMEGINEEPATDRIVSDLLAHCNVPHIKPSKILALQETGHRIARTIPGLRIPPGLRNLQKQKFPGIELTEVRRQINMLARLRSELNKTSCERFENVPNTFKISCLK